MDALQRCVQADIDRGGDKYAIQCLIGRIQHSTQVDNEFYHSRFYERVKVYDDQQNVIGHKLDKRIERQVSTSIDMADQIGEDGEFFYDDDGVLYPVTVGAMSRQEMGEHDIVYGSADLIANGKVVGTVTYTDH